MKFFKLLIIYLVNLHSSLFSHFFQISLFVVDLPLGPCVPLFLPPTNFILKVSSHGVFCFTSYHIILFSHFHLNYFLDALLNYSFQFKHINSKILNLWFKMKPETKYALFSSVLYFYFLSTTWVSLLAQKLLENQCSFFSPKPPVQFPSRNSSNEFKLTVIISSLLFEHHKDL